MRVFCFFIMSVVLMQLFSCGSRKELVYFQSKNGVQEIVEISKINNSFKINKGDVIGVVVSAEDLRSVQPFSYPTVSSSTDETFAGLTYTVDNGGYITMPKVGKLYVEGLTRVESTDLIKEALAKFILDPQVTVEIRGMHFTILGDVGSPGVYPIQTDRITILEAIATAGDLSIQGKRNNILVIREVNGKAIEHRIDITSNNLFESPVYYLAQNDVVYVEPNQSRLNASKQNPSTNLFFSIASLALSVIILLTR